MRFSDLKVHPDACFRVIDKNDDLGKKSAKGGLVSVVSQFIRFSAQVVSLSILARLLDPADFGYLAMATVLVNIFKMFGGNALTTGIIQQRTVTNTQVSGFFWISIGVSLVFTILAVSLAPTVSWFFKEEILIPITALLALQIVFSGACASHVALLTRSMSFGLVAGIDLVAGVLSKVVGVTAAFMGAGYWALVFIPVAQDGFKAMLAWYFCRWRPSWTAPTKETSSLLRFGAKMSITSIFNTLSGQIDGVLIGKYFDSMALGLYSKSLNLVQLPAKLICWPLESVAVSTLSKMQDDPVQHKKLTLTLVENFLMFTTPLLSILFLTAPQVVGIVLGDKWLEAIPIFRYLGLMMLIQSFASPLDWFLVSTAQLKKFMVLAVSGNVVRICAIVVGLTMMAEGPVGVAKALMIAMAIYCPLAIIYSLHNTAISVLDYLRATSRVVVAIIVSTIITVLVENQLAQYISLEIVSFAFFAVLSGLIYLGVLMLLPGGKETLFTAVRTLLEIIAKRTSISRDIDY